MAQSAMDGEDPAEVLGRYLESPGRLKREERWRAVVIYRCKRSHTLAYVVKVPAGYVVYNLRRESQWPGDAPSDMAGYLPALEERNGDFDMPLGGCKCQPVRSRRLTDIWGDVERWNRSRRPLDIRV